MWRILKNWVPRIEKVYSYTKIYYTKIDNLIWGVLKNEYVKLKKKVLILKYTEIFTQTDVNAFKWDKLYGIESSKIST